MPKGFCKAKKQCQLLFEFLSGICSLSVPAASWRHGVLSPEGPGSAKGSQGTGLGHPVSGQSCRGLGRADFLRV